MAGKKTMVHEHQSAVDEIDLSIQRYIEELGRLLIEDRRADIDELKDFYTRGTEIQVQMEVLEKQRDEIRHDIEKQKTLKDSIAEIESNEKIYRDGYRKMVGSLGAHSYRVYRSGAIAGEEFPDVFTGIERIEAEGAERNRQIQELASRQTERNFFQKLPSGARITYLKTSLGRLEKKKEGCFPEIGEKLLKDDLVEKIPDEQVQSITGNLKHEEEQSQERGRQIEKLQAELDDLQQRVIKLSEPVSPDKRMKELSEEISAYQERFLSQCRELGQAFLLLPSLAVELPEEIETTVGQIDDLKEQRRAHENHVHILQAEMEIDTLQDGIRKKEEQISKLEKKINEEKQQIKSLKDDLSHDKNRIEELRKITAAGPAEQTPS